MNRLHVDLQNEILQYIVYPLPYMNQETKQDIKKRAQDKLRSLLIKMNVIFNLNASMYVYNNEGRVMFNYFGKQEDKYLFIAFM
jgi:hypothetical protein